MKKELFAALFESALMFKRVAAALRPQYVRLLGAMTRGVNEAGAEDVRRIGEIFGLQPARIAKPQRRGSAFMWGGLVLALCNSAPASFTPRVIAPSRRTYWGRSAPATRLKISADSNSAANSSFFIPLFRV